MSSLQAEIAYLKREIEKGRERRPPLTPPTSPLFPQPALTLTSPALSLVSSDTCKDLTAKTLKLYLNSHLEFIRSHTYGRFWNIFFINAGWKFKAAFTNGSPCNWFNGNLWSSAVWPCVRQTHYSFFGLPKSRCYRYVILIHCCKINI